MHKQNVATIKVTTDFCVVQQLLDYCPNFIFVIL